MLRERRRVLNQSVKPNRRLDRKSSRGMVFENEELRLRTINISADVERGQSDIRKLRRENELLRREIWTLRDEYDRLDKLLQDHHQRQLTRENSDENHTHHHHHHHHHDTQNDCNDDSSTCDDETESSSDSCSKCTIIENYRNSGIVDDEPDKIENGEHKSDDSSGKIEGGLRTLSTVSEETGGHSEITDFDPSPVISENIQWTDSQLNDERSMTLTSFKMGGNLEELLTDIANLSHDIRKLQMRGINLAPTGSNEYLNCKPDILANSMSMGSLAEKEDDNCKKPFRSEVNLILSATNIDDNPDDVSNDSPIIIPPLLPPLIGFEKFVEVKIPALHEEPTKPPELQQPTIKTPTDFARKNFIKSPSVSLNEKPTKQHSNDKRLSLDLNPAEPTENKTTTVETNGSSKSKTPQTTAPTTPTTPTTPKSKKKRNIGIFFKRNKKDKSKKQNDDDDDDFYFQSPANQMNTSGGLRTTAKQQKQLFKMKTKNPKLRKQQMQQQQYRRNIVENRKSENSNNSKKYARLSIDENFDDEIEDGGDGDGCSGVDSNLDKNSGGDAAGGSENHSSNESTSSSFRSRKLSITSYPKKGGGVDKIPWCACWGNGCF